MEKPVPEKDKIAALAELERGVYTALETYSNVHRGSGHNSLATTQLFDQARQIVLEHLGLSKRKYVVVFCPPRIETFLRAQLKQNSYHCLSSHDFGLPIGVRALAVKRRALPGGIPFLTGGGTARLVSPGWVIWAKAPERFEAGTPAIVNIIAFAKALLIIRHYGNDILLNIPTEESSARVILYHHEPDGYAGQELLDKLRETLIGSNIQVPTTAGEIPFINLDNAASTPTFRPVWETVRKALRQPVHVQQDIIREVKSKIAEVLGAPLPIYEFIFTSNTTEAINLAAENLNRDSGPENETVILNTFLEHNSNELPWREISNSTLIRLPIDDEGFLDLEELEALLRAYNQESRYGKKRIRMVTVSGASNVLGTFNNLAEIGRIVHQYGAQLLVDAAQLIAHRPVSMEECGIDYLAFSGHKVYAPFGTGVLVARKGLLHFSPAELEQIQASGEENVVGIAALGKALVLLQRIGFDVIQKDEQQLTARTLLGLSQIESLTIHGVKDPDSPRFAQKGGVIAFSLKKIMPNVVARELAKQGGIGVRYGCHCSHILIKRLLHVPPALERFQHVMLTLLPMVVLPGVTRVSLGIENTPADIDHFIDVLGKIARQPKPLPKTGVHQQMDDFISGVAFRVYDFHE